MPKIRGGDRPARPVDTSKAKGKSEVAKSTKASETKKTAKVKDNGFPRAAWNDTAKLTGLVTKTKDRLGLNEHPRMRHTKVDKDPIGGKPTRPPIVARYGLIMPTPTEPTPVRPPIVARYGLIMPKPDQPTPPPVRPPIVARYGLIMPKPDEPAPKPPIVARYGLIMPKPDEPAPRPPIVARYGLIMPRPGIPTSPREGVR